MGVHCSSTGIVQLRNMHGDGYHGAADGERGRGLRGKVLDFLYTICYITCVQDQRYFYVLSDYIRRYMR